MLFKDLIEMIGDKKIISDEFINGLFFNLSKIKRISNIKIVKKDDNKVIITFDFKSDKKIYNVELEIIEHDNKIFMNVEVKNYVGNMEEDKYFEKFKNGIFQVGLNGFSILFEPIENVYNYGTKYGMTISNVLMNVLK
jgi:hypothetical protein